MMIIPSNNPSQEYEPLASCQSRNHNSAHHSGVNNQPQVSTSEYFSFSKNERAASNQLKQASLNNTCEIAISSEDQNTNLNNFNVAFRHTSGPSQLASLKQSSIRHSRSQSSLHSSQNFYKSNQNGQTTLNGTKTYIATMYGKARFTDFSGDILDLISEYLPQTSEMNVPPVFAMCNSIVLRNYCEYKRENYGIQIEILIDQIGELKRELFEYFDQKLFKMSKNLSIIYHSNIQSKEWSFLEELSRERALNKDDQTLVKVYLILLGQQVPPQNMHIQNGSPSISKLSPSEIQD